MFFGCILLCPLNTIDQLRKIMKNLPSIKRVMEIVLIVYAFTQIGFLVYLWFNHFSFPLNLEAMELYILSHVKRALLGLPIYIAPSESFIPFVYNPLYYYLSIPFVKIFGVNLQALRFVSILGSVGSMVSLFLITKRLTGSASWGIISVGLFAASYRAMDTYTDTAHADTWLLFMILLGCYLIDLRRSQTLTLFGVVALVLSFWFKQHGALFLVGSVLYLTYRDGFRNSWKYWLVALVLGFGLYIYYPVSLFGTYFHYYTWEVPRRWSQIDFNTITHIIFYVVRNYSLLSIVAVLTLFVAIRQSKSKLNIWLLMLPVAMMSGAMGSLDPENNNNVFIPMATWFIIVGIFGLSEILKSPKMPRMVFAVYVVVVASFGFLYYQPGSVIIPKESKTEYRDLNKFLADLDGTVYAPWIGGALQDGYGFQPPIHWVPIYDLIREPGVNVYYHPLSRQLLQQLTAPEGNCYILTNYPLENDIVIGFLSDYYVLENDLGTRFSALSTLPRRYNLKWPRYLYRYDPAKAE